MTTKGRGTGPVVSHSSGTTTQPKGIGDFLSGHTVFVCLTSGTTTQPKGIGDKREVERACVTVDLSGTTTQPKGIGDMFLSGEVQGCF